LLAASSIIMDSCGWAIGSHIGGWNMMEFLSTGAAGVEGVQGAVEAPAVLACFCTDARCWASEDSMAARMRSACVSCTRKRANQNVTLFLSAGSRCGASRINLT
jgi:hypothetical protein